MERLVTVVIPLCNMAAYLDACMAGVLAQTYTALDILLVDDGSTDESPAMCDAYAQRDERVRVIHQPNGGISYARNTGIEAAKGEYITFVDADDVPEPHYVQVLMTLCDRYDVKLAACNHWLWRGDDLKPCFDRDEGEKRLTQGEALHRTLYHKAPDVSVWGKVYHRSLMETVRFPMGKLFEDTYCFGDIMRGVQTLAYTSEPLYRYRIRVGSISHCAYSDRQEEYIDAVAHFTQVALKCSPQEEKGCARRKMHALLSTRRCLVDCPVEHKGRRARLEKQIRAGAWPLLWDREAPLRDKIGALVVCIGSKCYDLMWKGYSHRR